MSYSSSDLHRVRGTTHTTHIKSFFAHAVILSGQTKQCTQGRESEIEHFLYSSEVESRKTGLK